MPRARARRRAHRLAAVLPVVAGALVVSGLAVTTVGASAAAATLRADDTAICTAGAPAALSTGEPLATDTGVAVLVGGSYTAQAGAKESEGVLAVVGDVRVATDDLLNVGRAGGGSQIVPPAGTAMLVAGGTIDATGSTVDVGHGIVSADASGGDVVAGGEIRPSAAFETNGGALLPHQGADVADLLRPMRDALAPLAADLAAQPATGTTTLADDLLTLTASGPAEVHVFDVRAEDLAVARTLLYVGTGSSPVVVDVSGSDVDYGVVHTAVGTLPARVDDPSGASLGPAATRVLWNFADATSVDLGDGTTTSQLVGSVLVPREDSVVRQRTHTNGRMWVGGDLVVGGAPGLEHHNYPWVGAEGVDCAPAPAPDVPAPDAPDPAVPADPPVTDDTDGPSDVGPGEQGADDHAPELDPAAGAAPDTSLSLAPLPLPSGAALTAAAAVSASGAQGGDELVATGVSAALPVAVAALLLAAGMAALLAVRSRRRATAR